MSGIKGRPFLKRGWCDGMTPLVTDWMQPPTGMIDLGRQAGFTIDNQWNQSLFSPVPFFPGRSIEQP